jgi:hypothetical protein
MDYKSDLRAEEEYRPNCDQCDRPAVALLDGWPVCGEHWAQYRKNRMYRPATEQGRVRLDGATIAAALTPPANTRPVVTARRAIEALERSVGK